MLDRRQLLWHGLAASALSAIPLRALPLESGRRVDLAIVDSGLGRVAEMVQRFRRLANRHEVFRHDPGLLWMHRIEPMARSAPVVIAGYTSAPTMYCLQYLGRDHGLTLQGFESGPQPPERISFNPEAELVDLRELPNHDSGTGFTWVLGPKEE